MNIRKDPRSTRPGKIAKKWLWSARRCFLRMGDGQKMPQDMVSLARHNKDNWGYFMDISRYI